MASFPGAVKTFTVRANGQTIADTWFNEPDDEITAIEDGLRNGTAPLNSSNSTFTNVSITGGSTVTGTLTVGGNSSFTGALHVAGNSTVTNLNATGGSTFSVATVTNTVTGSGAVVLGGVQSLSLSSGNNNDLAVSSATFYLRLTGNASGSTLTGLATANGVARVLFVQNVGAADIVFVHNTGSVSSNRFALAGAATRTFQVGDGGVFIYDVATSFYRPMFD